MFACCHWVDIEIDIGRRYSAHLTGRASVPPSHNKFPRQGPSILLQNIFNSTRRLWCTGLVYNVTQSRRSKMWKKLTSSTSLAGALFLIHKGTLTFHLWKALNLPYRWVSCMTGELYCELNASAESARGKKSQNFTWQPPQWESFLEHRRRAGYGEAPLQNLTWKRWVSAQG